MLSHGGGIFAASRRYGIPLADWLDLSTGLNPEGWPVPDVPARSWQRLPEMADGLEEAAADYYGSPLLLAVAGSQPAIQGIPRLRPPGIVAVLETTYAEHPHAWDTYGHQVCRLPASALDVAADHVDVIVVCNPNNPTGLMFAPELLESWRRRLAVRGGWLVVDEAFIDATPEESMMPLAGQPGLIILRSIGKFFGLAGARVGFVFAWPALLDQLGDTLGPWTVSGPGRFAAKGALLDRCWQEQTRLRLARDAARLADCLAQFGLLPAGGTRLFQWWQSERARALHEALARAAILTRYFDAPCSIRFGLPATENDWLRLAEALGAWAKQA
jgi:cobalamin biosynthetic protein CobC